MNKEIKEAAVLSFISNPKVDVLHITRDGQSFEQWHDANEHSKSLGASEDDRKIEEVQRKDVSIEEVKKTLLEQIEECTTVEAVEALIKGNSPKIAKEAAALKIEALKGE